MTTAIAEAFVTVRPDGSRFGAELSGILSTAFGRAGAEGAALGGLLKVGVGAGLAVIAGEATDMAIKFQAAMERLHTQANVPQSSIKGLSNTVLNLAGQVGVGPTSLAEAFYHVESSFAGAGKSSAELSQILRVAAEGARVGGANIVDVTNALDAAIVSGIPGVENFQQAMGALNATVGAGDMSMQNLADALGTGVLAVIKGYGVTLRDASAALAVFGDNNIRGSLAGNQLRQSVQALTVPTKLGVENLAKLGLTADGLAKTMQTQGLGGALDDLSARMTKAGITGNKVGEFLTQTFGKRAGVGVSILVEQLDRLHQKYGEVALGSTQFGDAWNRTQETTKQKLAESRAAVDALAIRVGTFLLPAIGAIADAFTKIATLATGHFAVALGVAAGAVVGLTIAFAGFGGVATGVGAALDAVFSPEVAIIALFAALGAGVVYAYDHFQSFKDAVDGVGAAFVRFGRFLQNEASVIVAQVARMRAPFDQFANGVRNAFRQAEAPIQSAAEFVKRVAGDVVDGVQSLGRDAATALSPLSDAVGRSVETVRAHTSTLRSVLSEFVHGNFVTGANTLMDSLGVSPATEHRIDAVVGRIEYLKEAVQNLFEGHWKDSVFDVGEALGLSFSQVQGIIRRIQSVGEAFSQLFRGNFTGVGIDIANALGLNRNQTGQLLEAIQNIKRAFHDLFRGNLTGVADDIGHVLGLDPKTVADIDTRVFHIQRALSSLFHGSLTGAVGNLAEALGLNDAQATAIQVRARQIVNGLKAAFTSLAAAVGPALHAVGDAIGGVVSFIGRNLIPILSGIGAALATAGIAALIGAITTAIGALLGAGAGLVAILAGLAAALASPVVIVGLLVAGLVYAYQHFEAFRNVVSNVASVLSTVVAGAFNLVVGIVQTLAPAVGAVAQFVGQKLQELGQFFISIAPVASQAFGNIAAFIQETLVVIVGAISLFIGGVQVLWSVFGGYILSAVQIVWGTIQGVISGVMLVIEGIIRLVLAIIAGNWGQAWQALKDIVAGVWDVIFAIVRGALGLLVNIIAAAGHAIGAAFRAIWDGLAGIVRDAWGGISSAIGGLKNDIVGFFKDAGSWLVNAGGDIIKGLINGIKGGFNDVKNTLGDLTSKIPGWKGPPATDVLLLASAGQLIMQGLMNGINSQRGALRSLLGDVTSDVAGVGSSIAGAGSGLGTGNGGGATVVNNYLSLNTNNSDADVQQQFARMARLSPAIPGVL